jgi:hypothetical protein
MAAPSIVLLEEVRAKRDIAAKARRLAWSIGDKHAAQQLEDYAAELDEIAADLERQAAIAKAHEARKRQLTAEINSQVTEATALTEHLLRKLKRSDGEPGER